MKARKEFGGTGCISFQMVPQAELHHWSWSSLVGTGHGAGRFGQKHCLTRATGGHAQALQWQPPVPPLPAILMPQNVSSWSTYYRAVRNKLCKLHCHGDSMDQLKEHMVLYSFELSLEGVDWGIYLVFSFQQMTKDKEIKLVWENPPPSLWEVGCCSLCVRKILQRSLVLQLITDRHFGKVRSESCSSQTHEGKHKYFFFFFPWNYMDLLLLKAGSACDL